MALSDTFVRQVKFSGAKSGDKHTDGDGMYLFVKAAGKYWRMNYRYFGKQKTLALGVYPDVSLADARRKRAVARQRLADGVDPGAMKKQAKLDAALAISNSFESIANEWIGKTSGKRVERTQNRIVSWFRRFVYPSFGHLPISEVSPRDVLTMLRKIEERGAIDSARRVRAYCSEVFQFAGVQGLVGHNPTDGLLKAMVEKQGSHYASITDPLKAGALLRSIDGYVGHPVVCAALRMAPYVFVRPGELRYAEWSEIDLDAAEWRIPGAKMKMKVDHIVPLARQVVDILKETHRMTGNGKFVFPGLRSSERPMSDNTVNATLRNMGYSREVMTGHGFRAMARTMMDEQLGERVDLIEHQLAHQVKDVHGRAYNRTHHLPGRREMMQRWADYLDKLRTGADVVPLRKVT